MTAPIKPAMIYHPVARELDLLFWTLEEVAVCGALVRYTRKQVMGKQANAQVTYSNAFDPLARMWKTEDAAMHCTIGASCGDRVE